mmetsp:Transcript_49425/g.120645  ORF Transcript_49425/g.120645 Transcript_49425/m.120645 type:complete len:295 (+) Transcript_49425:211-1095(+)|eukprot:CAMPEP_0206225678 /NCGR_PEP_ID=MMETSP0047_2-20121206/7675_1 /ASSEMBLY_ACC=CAM_ASM_000192 /TAXON_ID=195065 /ORGANISM="Chroomonas mesostigmatica_cf, Strain CCMP1168" /LENGTH=294 /DNA_ID=CAMNT_0053648693 /DNA_START=130 /DNA_END=1014 /DNA_ORIENTATION=+
MPPNTPRSCSAPLLLLLCIAGVTRAAAAGQEHKALVNRAEPFLSDLPGFTRAVIKHNYAIIPPESRVYGPLVGWHGTSGAVLSSPELGMATHFTMALAKIAPGGGSDAAPEGIERFVLLIAGDLSVGKDSLPPEGFAYLPPADLRSGAIVSPTGADVLIFERRYVPLDSGETLFHPPFPTFQMGAVGEKPLLDTPGEMFDLRKLLPTSEEYDFNIHVMDFQPGEHLNVKEVHVNQHGLFLLEGRGIYRLGNDWFPVTAGDAIWMAPYVTQWYAALGKSRSRYILYKDVNRPPQL